MTRWFNTAGPNDPADHYTLPALARLPQLARIIERKQYAVVHAPRQVGKTTALLALAHELTAGGRYLAALMSMEAGAPFNDDLGAAESAILGSWQRALEHQLPLALRPRAWPTAPPGARIGAALSAWARAEPRPLVLFLDEIDALQDDALISVLRQLRDGYRNRPEGFPWSLVLVGLRDVRDYRIGDGDRLGTSSPFNIKAESITLPNFTREEVAQLYGQHTADSGQRFAPDAIARVFELTDGQPWLVNALAAQLTDVLVEDRTQAVTAADVERAKDILVRRQDTHLDSLTERLREPRIQAIIEPMLAGEPLGDVPRDDRRFAVDLGLLRQTREGGLVVANPIYREVIATSLAEGRVASLPPIEPTWLRADGSLDPEHLLQSFLSFWRLHGEPLMRGASYPEVAPHLVLMAFLHRVVNGGGSIEREYAIGMGRMDLCVRHGDQTLAIEIKVWREGRPDPLTQGLAQIDKYLAGLGQRRGWLVIFDRRRQAAPLAERLGSELATTEGGRQVTVVRA